MSLLFRAHPWHGVPLGDRAPEQVTCDVEITTADTVKYEIDKTSGLLTLDRPQRYSNVCPTLYGLLPQTSKLAPGGNDNPCEITHTYGRDEAFDVIVRSHVDYHARYGSLESALDAALNG